LIDTTNVEVISVSKNGQVTVPEELRERFGIEAPERVLVREVDETVVVEPLPSVEEMRGIHAGDYEAGAVLFHLQEMRRKDEQVEADEVELQRVRDGPV
jgi:AbrB family looped-hinge helix DNA binding protein